MRMSKNDEGTGLISLDTMLVVQKLLDCRASKTSIKSEIVVAGSLPASLSDQRVFPCSREKKRLTRDQMLRIARRELFEDVELSSRLGKESIVLTS